MRNAELIAAREQAELDRDQYRAVARTRHPEIVVADHAPVQPVEDGAYVECTVWVPKSALGSLP